MKISVKCEYALLAILEMAAEYNSRKFCSLEEISQHQFIPQPFLVQILLELKNAGYVESRRGANGGYRLIVQPKKIRVGEVIELIEGPLLPVKCSSRKSKSKTKSAQKESILISLWDDIRSSIKQVVNHITFDQLVMQYQKKPSNKLLR